MFEFDHLAVACETLDEGAAVVEKALGLPLASGGRHPHFGTHNRLLSLGPGEYLEVIAIDPDAPPPPHRRWFALDDFSGTPRLTNWILRCGDLAKAQERLGNDIGKAVPLNRAAYRWEMAVPDSGVLPLDGWHPALIRWQGPHPADALEYSGCRLRRLTFRHPEAEALSEKLALTDERVVFETGRAALVATIDTPNGPRHLG